MKYPFLIIPVLITFLPTLEGFADCSIDSGLSTELANYVLTIDTKITELNNTTSNRCGTPGSSPATAYKKGSELIDRAMLQIPYYGDIVRDFEYNFMMAFRGESRSAVRENGKIFQIIRDKLTNTTTSLANSCNLTPEKEKILIELIKTNYVLENAYKITTTEGKAVGKESIPGYEKVFKEIEELYTPSATQNCKNEFDFEQKLSDALDKFSKGTFGLENAYVDWRKAIDLFSGGSKSKNYNDTARKLLSQELSRQGLSKKTKDVILGNFDCVKKAETGDSDLEDKMSAIADCKKFPILGLDNVKKAADKAVQKITNTETYVAQTQKNDQIIGTRLDIQAIYAKYNGEETVKMMTAQDENAIGNLVNIHISLLSINKLLEIRIPIMQGNCRKTIRDAPFGGCG